MSIESNIVNLNLNTAKELRESLNKQMYKSTIENPPLYINPLTYPVVFDESYIRLTQNKIEIPQEMNDSTASVEIAMKPGTLALHLVVLVHGFQGNSYDMRLIKYNLSLLNPTLVFLSSQANQDDTEIDFIQMGERLANEVKAFMKEWSDGVMFKRISFIGHSIGGIIIRSCLPHLKEFSHKMFLYTSLSSPHLGYIYSTSKLVDAGIWVLKAWKKSMSLRQLSFTDDKDIWSSCLYKLSEMEGLGWFEHVWLVSSHQDHYAPFESTRIQIGDKIIEETQKSNFYKKMAGNLLGQIVKDSLRRIDVNFVIPEK